jgi:hypothetical protein
LRHLPSSVTGLALVLVLDLLHLRLNSLHLLHLVRLSNRQRDHQHTDDDRENDDADTEVGPEEVIQQRQAVDHRAHDYFEPENTEDFHLRNPPFARMGARSDGWD